MNPLLTLDWRDGLPYSSVFDDVYFSSDDGWAETHYVFMAGNQLPQRWQILANETFNIVETGFGTGLNFWCAVLAWLTHAPQQTQLHFTSLEKYPISLSDMRSAIALWSDLMPLAGHFLQQYAHINQGENRLLLADGRVKLDLWIGDVAKVMPQLTVPCDAWFLDGFAPAKNPDMWQPELFWHMARLSKTGATFATFTSAGAVRRSLQQAGFAVQKQAGFGRKREMLFGHYPQQST